MRKPRELYRGAEYHVIAKSNRGEFILESAEVKKLFLETVIRAKKKYSFQIRDFTIMSNHVHLIIKPGENESLSQIMQWILSVFASNFNKHFKLKGHVWYDRFKSIVIESFEQLLTTFRYICNNPVKAKMVENAEDYVYGALWFIKHKHYELVEPPDPLIIKNLPEFFGQHFSG